MEDPEDVHTDWAAGEVVQVDVDVGAGDLVRPGHVILEVDLVGEVHLGGDGGEDEALLPAVRQGELDLAVEAA